MDYSDDFIAGWQSARVAAQRSGSVPPWPPGYAPGDRSGSVPPEPEPDAAESDADEEEGEE